MVETKNTDNSANSNNDKEKEKKKPTFKEKVKFYVTFTAASVGICTFSLFLFLIPFVIDPAIATINHDFVETPVQCRVVINQYILGASKCSWSSCREGCTTDLFECNHVYVEYTPRQEDVDKVLFSDMIDQNRPMSSSNQSVVAMLMVNIRSCGYPPEVVCETWYNVSGVNDSVIPCHYSRTNSSLAITNLDPDTDTRDLVLSIIVPIIVCVISGIIIVVLHFSHICCSCCSKQAKEKEDMENGKQSSTNLEMKSMRNIVNQNSIMKSTARKWLQNTQFHLSSSSIKRKAELFDLPTLSKKLKTVHMYSDIYSSSPENFNSTSTTSASSTSCASKEPPSPDIF